MRRPEFGLPAPGSQGGFVPARVVERLSEGPADSPARRGGSASEGRRQLFG